MNSEIVRHQVHRNRIEDKDNNPDLNDDDFEWDDFEWEEDEDEDEEEDNDWEHEFRQIIEED